MKLIDKMANGIEVLAPIIILFFACGAYWRYSESEKFHPEKFRREIQQGAENNKVDNVSEAFIPFRD